jgi:hypothetical protein
MALAPWTTEPYRDAMRPDGMTNEWIDALACHVRVTARLPETIVGPRSNETDASMMADKIVPLQPTSNWTSA